MCVNANRVRVGRQGGVDDAAALGTRAESLGKRLLEPGRCLTMSDLWPPSVLVTDPRLRLLDWELAHYGHPLQEAVTTAVKSIRAPQAHAGFDG